MRAVGFILLLLGPLAQLASADYIIEQLVESPGQSLHITVKLKDIKYRFDIREMGLSFFIDSTTGETIVLQASQSWLCDHFVWPAGKVYMRLSAEHIMPPVGTMDSGVAGQTDVDGMADLKPTGRTERINGYETEEFVGKIAGKPMSVFVARDFPNYQKIKTMLYNLYSNPGLDACRNLLVPPDKYPGMPIRLVRKVSGQKMCSTLQSVRETNLDDSEFAIPAEYKEFKLDAP